MREKANIILQWNLSNPTHQGTGGNVSDCTACHQSNPTHQGAGEMCQIVQHVRTCLIRHTKGPGKCVRLYKMSEPV
jgi:hypothetical protein